MVLSERGKGCGCLGPCVSHSPLPALRTVTSNPNRYETRLQRNLIKDNEDLRSALVDAERKLAESECRENALQNQVRILQETRGGMTDLLNDLEQDRTIITHALERLTNLTVDGSPMATNEAGLAMSAVAYSSARDLRSPILARPKHTSSPSPCARIGEASALGLPAYDEIILIEAGKVLHAFPFSVMTRTPDKVVIEIFHSDPNVARGFELRWLDNQVIVRSDGRWHSLGDLASLLTRRHFPQQ